MVGWKTLLTGFPNQRCSYSICSRVCHAIAKVDLGLSRYRRFAGSEVHAECVAECTEALVEMIASQILNKKSNISGSDDVLDTYRIATCVLHGWQAEMRMLL